MTSDSAISVIMLIVKPATYMKKNVAMTEVGSASARDERRAPVAHEDEDDQDGHDAAEDDVPRARRATFSLMNVGVVVHRADLRAAGSSARRVASAACTRSAMSTVLAPDCLRTENDTASAPFRRVVDVALLVAVHDRADVADADGRAAVGAQDDVLDLVDASRTRPSCAATSSAAVALHLAAGHVEVLGGQLVGDLGDGRLERLEPAADRGPPGSRAPRRR